MEKIELMEYIKKEGAWISGNNVMKLFPEFSDDREIAKLAVSRSAKSVEFLSDGLKNDVELMRIAINTSFIAYQHMGTEAKKDSEIVSTMIHTKSNQIFKEKNNLPKEIFADKELMLASLKSSNNVKYFDKSLQEDPEFAKQAIEINYKSYKNFPESIRDNADVLMHGMTNGYVLMHGMTNGYHRDSFFKHCSDRLKGDKQFVLETLNAHKNQLTDMGFLKITNYDYESIISESSKEIQELCKGKDPIETLTKAIESEKLYEQLQKDLSKPKESSLDFAKKLSQECKEHAQSKEQGMEQSKPKARMKI